MDAEMLSHCSFRTVGGPIKSLCKTKDNGVAYANYNIVDQ